MAYSITLTAGERKAIDWIGRRYRHGDELQSCLWAESKTTPEDADWDSPDDITSTMPEHVAWQVAEIVSEGLDCFGPELCHKLESLANRIV